jgi:hypothetical protein
LVAIGNQDPSLPSLAQPTRVKQKKSRLSRLHLKFIGNQISMVIVVLVASEFQFAILMVIFFFPPFGG